MSLGTHPGADPKTDRHFDAERSRWTPTESLQVGDRIVAVGRLEQDQWAVMARPGLSHGDGQQPPGSNTAYHVPELPVVLDIVPGWPAVLIPAAVFLP